MELKRAILQDQAGKIDAKEYIFEFETDVSEKEKTVIRLSVEKVDKELRIYESQDLNSAELKAHVVSAVDVRSIYIANERDRELFYKIAEFIVKAESIPANVKTIIYPGSALILIEYGTYGIDLRSILKLQTSITRGLATKTIEVVNTEVKEEKETEPVDPFEIGEEPFPFGGEKGDFVEDEFNLGQVEEGEPESD